MQMQVRASDGHYWEMLFFPADRSVATLYWLPALGVPADKYTTWAQALAARGISVVLHEWRGGGTSSVRPSRQVDWNYRTLLEIDLPAGLKAAAAALPGPRWLLGGHSLGGQLAALSLARDPDRAQGLVLLATGVPHASHYSVPRRWLVAAFARSLHLVTALFGYFPGDRLRWAGKEASGVMRDWATTVARGDYRRVGLSEDPEPAMAGLRHAVLGIGFLQDWLVPQGSLAALLAKLGAGRQQTEWFDDDRLAAPADHFRWMRAPANVASTVSDWAINQLR